MPRTARKQSAHPHAADKPRVGVVVSRYNASITDELMEGAATAYANRWGDTDAVVFIPVPGAFELAAIAAEMAASCRFDALVALGCIIRGETAHDQHLARAVTDGLMRISIDYRIPVGLGVLTVNNAKQARDRAGGGGGRGGGGGGGGKFGNKGEEAMDAALDAFAVIEAIRFGESFSAAAIPTSHTMPDKAARSAPRPARRAAKMKKGGHR